MKQITSKDIRMPRRRKASHKGENGSVLIIGGSPEYPGAVTLAGLGALRAGSDVVRIAAPAKVAWAVNCLSPDLITIKLAGHRIAAKHVSRLLSLASESDCVLIGNGLGKAPWVRRFLHSLSTPTVIDADALRMIALKDATASILTPHKKEFESLCDNSGIPRTVAAARKEMHPKTVIILKGKTDWIFTKTAIYKNTRGNPGMTVAGTGDVLAGIAAGFVSQKLPLLDSAINAAYLCSLLGDRERKKRGYSFIASDLVADSIRMRTK